jgi:hypothetical protein
MVNKAFTGGFLLGYIVTRDKNKDVSFTFFTLMNSYAALFGHFEQFPTPLIDYLPWGYRSGYGMIAEHGGAGTVVC